jgi:hydroxymethylpyrimidine pyrophosphatase-like HAD family hydrolase
MYSRRFAFFDRTENYRPELKEGIITIFPPDVDIEISKSWLPYFEEVVKTFRLKLKIQRHSDGCIDIVPAQVSKSLGIDQVCQLYGCCRGNLLTVVDGVNDMELTEGGVNVIAVGNAVLPIKEAARRSGGYVAAANDGDGFIEGLRHYAAKGMFKPEVNAAILAFKQ